MLYLTYTVYTLITYIQIFNLLSFILYISYIIPKMLAYNSNGKISGWLRQEVWC
jgi:hypothetical protein